METLEKMINTKKPAILSIDIETSPLIAYAWGPKWETNLIEVLEQSKILSFSAKWLAGKQVTLALPDYKGYKRGVVDDERIVKDLRILLDSADIVIAQNGRDFDMKVINARILQHGLPLPSPYKLVDTKVEAKKYIRLPSYSLEDMGAYFGLGHKMTHEGFELWKRCIAGDADAWTKMKKYNAQDVTLMEQVYMKLRPFMKTHPNVSAYTERDNCPKCGSDNVHLRGYAINNTTKYQRAQCQDCSGWYKVGKAIKMANKPGTGI
jgi:DNA polymerase elongation subunit (family B)